MVQQGDQGVLNAVLAHETYCFEPRFNAVTIFFDFSYKEMLVYRKPPQFYSEEAIMKAVASPVLIHYTTSFLSRRPWVEGCRHKYVDAWLNYKRMSPWKDQKIWEYEKKSGVSGMYTAVISKLPRKLGIWISGLLQAYGRPFYLKFKYR